VNIREASRKQGKTVEKRFFCDEVTEKRLKYSENTFFWGKKRDEKTDINVQGLVSQTNEVGWRS